MKIILDIYYYVFYRAAKFAKDIFDYGEYLFWGSLISTFLIWNYITAIIEWGLGAMNISHKDWYYFMIGVAATSILCRYVLTEERYTKLDEKYSITPIKYKTFVDILIPLLLILSVLAQVFVAGKYDTRIFIDIRKELFHH